jgi:hypothetical protein
MKRFFLFLATSLSFCNIYAQMSVAECTQRNDLFNKIADCKTIKQFPFLAKGSVSFKGNTVIFNFIPADSSGVKLFEYDKLIVGTREGETFTYTREIADLGGRIAIDSNGRKNMQGWSWLKDGECVSLLTANDNKFFSILQEVLEFGTCCYSEACNVEMLFYWYHIPREEGEKLINNVFFIPTLPLETE